MAISIINVPAKLLKPSRNKIKSKTQVINLFIETLSVFAQKFCVILISKFKLQIWVYFSSLADEK